MEKIIKIADYNWKPGSQTEMLYENDAGEFFIGPPKNISIGNSYVVEVNDELQKGKYYRIKKFIT